MTLLTPEDRLEHYPTEAQENARVRDLKQRVNDARDELKAGARALAAKYVATLQALGAHEPRSANITMADVLAEWAEEAAADATAAEAWERRP